MSVLYLSDLRCARFNAGLKNCFISLFDSKTDGRYLLFNR